MNYFKDKNNKVFAYEDNAKDEQIKDGLTPISESEFNELIAPKLEDIQAQKVVSINSSCTQAIESGFESNALGEPHIYQSDELDQLNLIGVVASGVDQHFKCSANGGESWEWKQHTVEQLKQVLSDGAIVKGQLLQKAGLLKAQVSSASTVEELDAIEW